MTPKMQRIQMIRIGHQTKYLSAATGKLLIFDSPVLVNQNIILPNEKTLKRTKLSFNLELIWEVH